MSLVRRALGLAALSGACACSLISGAADLEIDPGSDAGTGGDATVPPPPPPEPPTVDARVDLDDASTDAASEDGGGPPACGTDPSLVLYLRFDEPVGSLNAAHCAPGLEGRIADAARFIAAGKVRGAVDTTDGYVELGTPAVLGLTGPLTVSMWVKPTVIPNSGAAYFFGRRGATAGPGYRIGVRPQGVTFIAVTDQGMSAEAIGPNIPVGQWTHVAGIFDPGNAARVYVSGKLERSQGAANIAALGGLNIPTRVGVRGDTDPGTNFKGAIDELRLYNRALSNAEIAALAAP